MPQRLRRIYFVFQRQGGFIYRPQGRNEDDPVMMALLKHCTWVAVDHYEPLIKTERANPAWEEKQAKPVMDRGTIISLNVGIYRIPVNDR